MAEQLDDLQLPGTSAAAPHPEEMRATFELRFSDQVSLKATARATPAGLVAVAVLLAAILVPVMWAVRGRG